MTAKPRLFFLVPSALLVFAVLDVPYGYYAFLRLAVTACAIVAAYASTNEESGYKWEAIVMGLIAILFNPIASVSLGPLTWFLMDLAAAGFLRFFALRARPKSRS